MWICSLLVSLEDLLDQTDALFSATKIQTEMQKISDDEKYGVPTKKKPRKSAGGKRKCRFVCIKYDPSTSDF